MRAAIKTVRPKDELDPDPFKRYLFVSNVQRVRKVIDFAKACGAFLKSCYEWKYRERSVKAFIAYELFIFFFQVSLQSKDKKMDTIFKALSFIVSHILSRLEWENVTISNMCICQCMQWPKYQLQHIYTYILLCSESRTENERLIFIKYQKQMQMQFVCAM